MATTSSSYTTTQISKSHLPPSPPPSPPAASRKRHTKKRSNSFEKLANTPLPSPTSSEFHDHSTDHKEEPLLVRIVLTPILFISFILSLTLVNLRDRLSRIKSHPPSSTSLLTYLFPSSWLDPEPYQDPDNSTWARRNSVAGHVEPHDAIGPRRGMQESKKREKRQTWHLNKKIRKVAKLEVSDAFEMRGRVMVGMGLMVVFGVVGMWLGMRWLVGMAHRVF